MNIQILNEQTFDHHPLDCNALLVNYSPNVEDNSKINNAAK